MKLFTQLEQVIKNYDTRVKLVDGLFFDQKELVRTIEFRKNSKYLQGDKDELGREKPYYQILNGIVDMENSAKDIDTKDIQATSDSGAFYTESLLMSKEIYEWMKESNFAQTLNKMIDLDSTYGTVLAKKCTYYAEDGKKELKIEFPTWKNVICNQTNILKNPIIEVHYLTPAELMAKEAWKDKEQALDLVKTNDDANGSVIKVYELRGEFPLSVYKESIKQGSSKRDENTYTYQLYYIAVGEKDKVILYSENNTEKVYKLHKRKTRDGRDFGVGVMEEGEEAQVWTNDAILKQFRAMEYTSKVIGQTSSKKLKGRNLITETEDGTILEVEDNRPITPVNLLPSGGLSQYANLIELWNSQIEKTTSSYSAQRGDTPASNTPFRLQALILQQSNSVFKTYRQNLGIFITEIFEDWVMPFLASQLNKEHILSHRFTAEELQKIDENFATYTANQRIKKKILNNEIVSMDEYDKYYNQALEFIRQTDNQRFLQVPKDYYKKFKAKITVNVTGEQFNKAAILESLVNIMNVYSSNPQLTQDPVLTSIFMRIIELSGAGISPVSIMSAMQQSKKQAIDRASQVTEASNPVSPNTAKPELSLSAMAGITGGQNA